MNTPVYAGPPSDPKWESILKLKIDVAPGSIEVPCDTCGEKMWIGPFIQKAHATNPWPFICYVCALKSGATPDDLVPLSPGGHKYRSI